MKDTTIKMLSGFDIAISAWLIISAFIFNFSGSIFWNSLLAGGLGLTLSSVREWGETTETAWASWFTLILGAWLIASSFLIGNIGFAFWNTLLAGVGVAAFSVGSLGPATSSKISYRA